ncbi:MAG: hypothetical protein J6T91_00060 [Alphaproteobacteria bacterium]|nr:hypothetical protein [Alphaproteobacteria bacterium]
MKKLAFSVFAAALTFGANAADNVEVSAAAATQTSGVFDGIYFGLGVAAVDNGIRLENKTSGFKLSDHRTRLAGTISLGYGRAIKEKAFIGLEAGLDAAQNLEFFGGRARINGLTPSAALRFGYVNPESKSMVYLKGGAAYSKASADWIVLSEEEGLKGKNFKCSKWAPIVALGAEKVCRNLRTRLEAEYRFRANKSEEIESITYKGINKGAITLRAMAVYTVKM